MRAMHRYEIWHNPRCGKSRAALKKLEDAGVAVTVVRYLDAPPSKAKLEKTLKQIGFDDPRRLMRTKEKVYKDLKLSAETRKGALVDAMVANPILIERPVVIRDDGKAVLGRPMDEVDRLL